MGRGPACQLKNRKKTVLETCRAMSSLLLPPLPNWEHLKGRDGLCLVPVVSPGVGSQPAFHEPSRKHFGQLHCQLMTVQVLTAKDSAASFTFPHTSLKQLHTVALSQVQRFPHSGLRHLHVEMQGKALWHYPHDHFQSSVINHTIRSSIYCTAHSPRHCTKCFIHIIFDLHKTHFTGKGTKIQKN